MDISLVNILNGAVPFWVLKGSVPATLDFDFANGRYYQQGIAAFSAPGNLITTSRASTGYASDTSGNYISFANNVARITNQGLLVEEARTNSIRNNSMQGAVAGTPGTNPTNWVIPNSITGLTKTIVGSGTSSGIDYVDVRWNGTLNSASVNNILSPDGTTVVAAVNGQTWTSAVFFALVGGSLSNITTLTLRLSYRDSGGSTLTSQDTNILTVAAALSQFQNTFTAANASTAFSSTNIAFAGTNGAAVDFTLRIGWPQLELGAFATSPIRTTSVAVTRAADVVTVTTPPVFGSAYTLFAKASFEAPTTNTVNQFLIEASDGTFNNRFALLRNNALGLSRAFSTSGGSTTSLLGAAWAQNTNRSIAASDIASSQNLSFNGGTVVTGAGSLPIGPLNKITIGSSVSGISTTAGNSYISEIAVFATSAQPAAQLQAFGSR